MKGEGIGEWAKVYFIIIFVWSFCAGILCYLSQDKYHSNIDYFHFGRTSYLISALNERDEKKKKRLEMLEDWILENV